MTLYEDAEDMRKLIAELKRNGEEFDVWYDISNLISHLKKDSDKYHELIQYQKEHYKQAEKDRQIVKRLGELIKNNNQYHTCKIGFPNSPSKQICLPCLLNTKLQKILKGKK